MKKIARLLCCVCAVVFVLIFVKTDTYASETDKVDTTFFDDELGNVSSDELNTVILKTNIVLVFGIGILSGAYLTNCFLERLK